MSRAPIQPRSLVLGFLLGGLATFALGFAAPADPAPPRVQHKIELDVDAEDVDQLVEDGWEFVGYLGVNKRGSNTDETLWRREDG